MILFKVKDIMSQGQVWGKKSFQEFVISWLGKVVHAEEKTSFFIITVKNMVYYTVSCKSGNLCQI